jgi:hypothetical protein
MADRYFNNKQTLEKQIKTLFAKVAIGATGAPTIVDGVGIASIARNGAGDYTITLQDTYNALKFLSVIHFRDTAQDLNFQLHSEAVFTAKTVRFLCLTGATPTDPANGQTLLIQIDLKNTSVV